MAEKVGDPGEYGKFRKIVTKKTADDKFPASIFAKEHKFVRIYSCCRRQNNILRVIRFKTKKGRFSEPTF